MTRTRQIADVAAELGLDPKAVTTLGSSKAKIDPDATPADRADGAASLVLVSAIGPTRFGEGKTTVSIGLADGLRRVGARSCLALREPSLGPVFGMKGGGTGGGRAQVVPADDINLHFTGDLHAVGTAHNLLAAMIDTELHFGARDGATASGIEADRVTWPRVLDMNDRALRSVVLDAGGRAERSSRFDITAASEVMATLALAGSQADLRDRLARTVVGWRRDWTPVTADDVRATEAMVALLRDALRPNLVQTADGTPALVHCGPFANIAHGCSSVLATRLALRHAEVVVTEAGFGFDLGGEKFLHLKAPVAEVWPRCVVLVVTVRALAHHGDGDLERGLEHLERQVANVRAFGLPVVLALNVFANDAEDDLAHIEAHARQLDARWRAARRSPRAARAASRWRPRCVSSCASPPTPAQPRSLYAREAPVPTSCARWRSRSTAPRTSPSRTTPGATSSGSSRGVRHAAGLRGQDPPLLHGRSQGRRLARGFTPTVAEQSMRLLSRGWFGLGWREGSCARRWCW
jgi:formate--tetrahydrofolate ligase